MAQQLGTPAARLEDSGPGPRALAAAHNQLYLWLQAILHPLLAVHTRHTHGTQTKHKKRERDHTNKNVLLKLNRDDISNLLEVKIKNNKK